MPEIRSDSLQTTIRVHQEISSMGQSLGQIPPVESSKIDCVLTGLERLRHKQTLAEIIEGKMNIAWLLGAGQINPKAATDQLDALDRRELYAESQQPPRLEEIARGLKLPPFLASAIGKVIDPRKPRTNMREEVRGFSAGIDMLYIESTVSEPETVVDTTSAMIPRPMFVDESLHDLQLASADIATSIGTLTRAVDLNLLRGETTYRTLFTMLMQYDVATAREAYLRDAKSDIFMGRLGFTTPYLLFAGLSYLFNGHNPGTPTDIEMLLGGADTVGGVFFGIRTLLTARKHGFRSMLPGRLQSLKPPKRPLALMPPHSE